MDTKKPVLCPWCGAKMEADCPRVHKRLEEPYDIYCSTFYVCHGCGATGPRTEIIIGDDDGLADKARECADKAYTDALRRPPQQPLTVEEVTNSCILLPCWLENAIGLCVQITPAILDEDSGGYFDKWQSELNADTEYYSKETYGKTWRVWREYPSDFERKAAAWKI